MMLAVPSLLRLCGLTWRLRGGDMYTDNQEVLDTMHGLQEQLETAFDEAREKFRCTLEGGRKRTTAEARGFQRKYRIGSFRYLLECADKRILPELQEGSDREFVIQMTDFRGRNS